MTDGVTDGVWPRPLCGLLQRSRQSSPARYLCEMGRIGAVSIATEERHLLFLGLSNPTLSW